jgi:hypothetical protein
VPALPVIEVIGGKMSSTSTPAAAVLGGLSDSRSWQEDLYRDIHQHPELSHQEHRTAKLVAERLHGSGYEVREGIGGTGVVGVMRNGRGPTVLMRADMDALPVEEATGLPYASSVPSASSATAPSTTTGREPRSRCFSRPKTPPGARGRCLGARP